MKNVREIYSILLLLFVGIGVLSCNKIEENKKQTSNERQVGFNSEGHYMGKKFDCPYNYKELSDFIDVQQKISDGRIKVTFTFGAFKNCKGCANCGCCFGLCIQGGKYAKISNVPLTDEEIKQKFVLFDYVDIPKSNQIIFLPSSNIDNGDRYVHVEDDVVFSEEVNKFIGRKVKIQKGSYEILYNEKFPFGAVVFNTL